MSKMLPIIILAGGLATRLQPLSLNIPKSLVKIAGEPFIFHQLRLLKKNNFSDVVICIGHFGEMIIDAVGNGEQFGLKINYSSDGNNLLGTAGAIQKALTKIESPDFFVMYGDSYLRCNFQAIMQFYRQQPKPALMTIYHNKNLYDESNIHFIPPNIMQYDKENPTLDMQHIDYGVSIFTKKIYSEYYNAQLPCLAGIHRQLLRANELVAFEVRQRFFEIGSFGGILDLDNFLNN